MFYYAHHRDMNTTQYVHVDVPSGAAVAWMSYYTHRSNTDAIKYVHVDVPSCYHGK